MHFRSRSDALSSIESPFLYTQNIGHYATKPSTTLSSPTIFLYVLSRLLVVVDANRIFCEVTLSVASTKKGRLQSWNSFFGTTIAGASERAPCPSNSKKIQTLIHDNDRWNSKIWISQACGHKEPEFDRIRYKKVTQRILIHFIITHRKFSIFHWFFNSIYILFYIKIRFDWFVLIYHQKNHNIRILEIKVSNIS